ncbi:hypothetical protein GUITHDRAFT_146950 [Guillardia theta CCMP2712]|uniref:Uncharacterized protein n=1 Tax=Guillardia theta (strain CCMP2712) TaxID=905079 RepID=L1IF25_GUITC|nr:hypothetical protein GUITHDRAFT_146950 [Guillardia theta CCMP2712]EKX34846.1 hypothetical protein GUITHDRAFT_146950 [Guillardia theta CCMP2712]|eukprot:XP_005821826.1 hypothetical protein GUITHDRAFT_146950 [Guillardia theta CCMP2712]
MYLYNDGQKIDLISYSDLVRLNAQIVTNLENKVKEKKDNNRSFKESVNRLRNEIMNNPSPDVMREKMISLETLIEKHRKEITSSLTNLVVNNSGYAPTTTPREGYTDYGPLMTVNPGKPSIISTMQTSGPSIYYGKVHKETNLDDLLIALTKSDVNLAITLKNIEKTIERIKALRAGGDGAQAAGNESDIPMATHGDSMFDATCIGTQMYFGMKITSMPAEKLDTTETALKKTAEIIKINEKVIKNRIRTLKSTIQNQNVNLEETVYQKNEREKREKKRDDIIKQIKALELFESPISRKLPPELAIARTMAMNAKRTQNAHKKKNKGQKTPGVGVTVGETELQQMAKARNVILPSTKQQGKKKPGQNKKGNNQPAQNNNGNKKKGRKTRRNRK